jgi:hypothetical protein
MKNAKREFTPEFKVESVKLWEARGRKSNEIGAQLGINPQLLAKWKRAMGQKTTPERCPIIAKFPQYIINGLQKSWNEKVGKFTGGFFQVRSCLACFFCDHVHGALQRHDPNRF